MAALLSLLWFLIPSSFAKEIPAAEAYGKILSSIDVKGLTKTRPFVVRREIEMPVGQPVRQEDFEETLARILNLEIFAKVEMRWFRESRKNVRLEITAEDRWTTIPFFSLQSGGGVISYRAGFFDINVFGTYRELGVQYENLTGTHSGVVWYRDPRFLNQRIRLGADLWATVRNRDLYTPNGDLFGAFTLRRNRFRIFMDKEFHRFLTAGGGIDNQWDRLSADKISNGRINLNRENQLDVYSSNRNHILLGYVHLGRIDKDVYLFKGYRTSLILEKSIFSELDFYRLTSRNQGFWRWKWDSNIGANLFYRHTNSAELNQVYYLGGFDAVRGFLAGQGRDKNAIYGNLEFRIPSLKTPWLILQHVVFVDGGKTAGQPLAVFNGPDRFFASVGTGGRLISPKIYSFNGRLDFAYTLGPDAGWGIAFGTQQFF